jgi:hypothetical protein
LKALELFDPKVHLVLTWTFVPLFILFLIGMVPLADFIPPTSPMDSAEEILAFYKANLFGIRLGQLIAAFGFTLIFAWGCAVSVWTYRIEKGFPILTFTQLMGCASGGALTFMIFLVWTVAAFRPEAYDAETILMVHDLGWFLFLWIVPPYALWAAAMGWAILIDKQENPYYPRWTAWVCFANAVLMETTMLIGFFKDGPFAYDGILGFWMPVIMYFIWMVVMTIYTHKAIMRRIRETKQGILQAA